MMSASVAWLCVALVVLCSACGLPLASARSIYVSADGSDSSGRGTSDSPYRHIAKALFVAADGDEVLVGPGTYTGSQNAFLKIDRSVEIRALGSPEDTTVDGSAYESVFLVQAEHVTIEGFTLVGSGDGPCLDTASALKSASLHLVRSVFQGCAGGLVQRNTIEVPKAFFLHLDRVDVQREGEVVCGREGTLNVHDSSLRRVQSLDSCHTYLYNSTLSGLFGDATKGNGGCWLATGGVNVAEGCTFSNCRASLKGGAVYGSGSFTNCIFSASVAGEYGGGVAAFGRSSFVGCSFRLNTAVLGGGLMIADDVQIVESSFTDNKATQKGGGIYSGYNNGYSDFSLIKNYIVGNSAGDTGGGIWAMGWVFVIDSIISGNRPEDLYHQRMEKVVGWV